MIWCESLTQRVYTSRVSFNNIMHLSNNGGPSPDGGGPPSSFISRMLINPVNIKVSI